MNENHKIYVKQMWELLGTPIECNATPIARTTDDFKVYVKYIYTVTNVDPTTENINSLSRTLDGNVKDLTSALDTTELVPGNDVLKPEIFSIDICQEDTTFSVSDDLDETSTSGTTCEDTAVYEIDVQNICDVEVESEFVLADDINTDFCLILPAEDKKDCDVAVNIFTL